MPGLLEKAAVIRDALHAVTLAVLRCSFLLILGLLIGALFAYVPQTREAIFMQLFPGFGLYSLYAMASLQGVYLAMVLIDAPTVRKKTRTAAEAYATHFVPGLIGFSFLALFVTFLSEGGENLTPMRRVSLKMFHDMFWATAIVAPLVRLGFDDAKMTSARSARNCMLATMAYLVVAVLVWQYAPSTGWRFAGLICVLAVTDIWHSPLGLAKKTRHQLITGIRVVSFCLAGLTFWMIMSPVSRIDSFGRIGFGPLETILLATNFWLFVALLATLLFRRIGLFLSTAISAIVLGFFITGPFNVEQVRTFQYGDIRIAPRRLDLKEYAGKWIDERLRGVPEGKSVPVFIVTADGGGIRAACWTAISLGALQDANSSFADHIFGISSVSGGSLGAVVFSALVKEQSSGRIELEYDVENFRGPIETHASRVLSHDFLSPSLLSMLVPDVLRTIFRTSWFQNRGASLEESFEEAWQTEVGTDALSKPFQQLWLGYSADSVPAVFLNGTRPDTGERLILSHVSLDGAEIDATDIQAWLGDQEVRASTAVMMSARFPGISPVGRIVRPESEAGDEGVEFLDIVDGGYFDNTGTATAADLYKTLIEVAEEKEVRDRIVPVLLIVPNSPRKRPETSTDEDNANAQLDQQEPTDPAADGGLLGALVSPVGTLDNVRSGVGARFRSELVKAIEEDGGVVLEFPLYEDKIDFPLGWMLSAEAREAMHIQVSEWKKNNKSDFASAIQLLKGPPPDAPSK